MLRVEDLTVAYGDIVALHGVTLDVAAGETVALIGANGAGKTTLLQTISGLIKVRSGRMDFNGAPLAPLTSAHRVRSGIAQAPEGRRIFPGLSVEENLVVATSSWRRMGASYGDDLAQVFDLFPRLKERRRQLGWSLSGGEQQMLAIGRALMSRPKLLLLDEPSLGLAPRLAEEVYDRVGRIRETGLTILVVEQNTVLALAVANRGYVLETGRVVLAGSADELRRSERVREAYLGR
ncbi:amino acid ABC transporter ATPase [Methylobacterium variabile]|jgi:branched-chain amino acid transport system ATP-binding protein|uniref:Amino acid ABC transporter ATPase n=1 Tax=Methylobacterium variabile TaxID=298794 RepID=A0A0J6TA45_9HYPH|nr:ABC transporter ATP-binding protein [Methylobacterium variabile]KMO42759.1 amino acid ABC transporter ATPase [Methylobacterium variabile]